MLFELQPIAVMFICDCVVCSRFIVSRPLVDIETTEQERPAGREHC